MSRDGQMALQLEGEEEGGEGEGGEGEGGEDG